MSRGGPLARFAEGSITDSAILAGISDCVDYLFHLATYHGNQSSIANPLEGQPREQHAHDAQAFRPRS